MDAMSGSEIPWPVTPKDNSGSIYIGCAVASVLAIAIGAGAGKIELALVIGGSVPILGVLMTLLFLGQSVGPMMKPHSGQFANFTSFSPEVEQSFVVFERTSHEISKRAATIGGASVGIAGLLFAIIVLTLATKHPEAPAPAAGAAPAAEQKH